MRTGKRRIEQPSPWGQLTACGLAIFFLRRLQRAGLVSVKGGPDVRNGER
jgi:hypothetical protein